MINKKILDLNELEKKLDNALENETPQKLNEWLDKKRCDLDGLTKKQKEYLSRFSCAWCDQPLNKLGCGAIFDGCSCEERVQKRSNCLKNYKERKHK